MTSVVSLAQKLQVSLGGLNFWVQNSGDDYALEQIGNTLRFEVRQGDVWAEDPAGIDRSEIASQQMIANGTPVEVSYGMTVESGATNTAAWTVLGQFHQDDADPTSRISPPFTIRLVGDKMQIVAGYTGPTGAATYLTLFTDATTLVRGHNYAMDVQAVFDPKGNGRLVVTRDGATIVNYSGPLGFASQSSVYWKEGIYRSDSPQTLAVDYANLTLKTSNPIKTATTAAPGPQVIKQYDAGGNVLSTTSYVYDANGNVTQQSVVNADGSGEVKTWAITGQTYVATDQVTNSAGMVISLTRTHADGTLDYQQTTDNSGVTTASTYNADGDLASLTITQADGSRAIVTYLSGTSTPSSYLTYNALGVLTLKQIFFADGSKKVQHFAITGQSYNSERITYDAAGRQIALARYHADGTRAFLQTLSSRGDTTTASYDASGGLLTVAVLHADGSSSLMTYWAGTTHASAFITYDTTGRQTFNQQFNSAGTLVYVEIDNSDGSKKVQHFGITGQAYTTEKSTYDKTGKLIAVARYHADGTLAYLQSIDAQSNTTLSSYDASGKLLSVTVTHADGSSSLKTFGSGSSSASALIVYDTDGSQLFNEQLNSAGQVIYQETDDPDGSREVQHFLVQGRSYTSDDSNYDSKGLLVSQTRYHADGSLDYQQTVGDDGRTITSVYDAKGVQQTTSTLYADGSSDIDTFGPDGIDPVAHQEYDAGGTLVLNETFNADGTTKIQHYGITGQSYVSDSILLDAKGRTIALAQYHADKTLDYTRVANADGSTTANDYNAAGTLIETLQTATDGSLSAELYAANIKVTSTAGNDSFFSYHGDTFAFGAGAGQDVIYGFNAGSASTHDTIQVSKATVADFAHLAMTRSGSDAVIRLSGTSAVTLKGVAPSALTASDFLFT